MKKLKEKLVDFFTEEVEDNGEIDYAYEGFLWTIVIVLGIAILELVILYAYVCITFYLR